MTVEQQTMMLETPVVADAGLTMITLGGSHRAIQRAVTALTRAGIRQKWLGPVQINSNRHNYAIATADLDRALALDVGIARSRDQWDWLRATSADSYFAK